MLRFRKEKIAGRKEITMAYLEELDGFYGTGEKNKAGQTLEEFLGSYNPKKYDCPSNTTDIVVVRCEKRLQAWGQPLKILLVKRANHPSIGFWATPGGFVELREDLYEGAARELFEETGVEGLPLEQLCTWGDYKRDPRWRVITTSFLALVEGDVFVKAGDDAADALWLDVDLHLCEENSENREVWELRLENKEHSVSVGARVLVTRSGHRLLPQEKYRLLKSDGLAVDHGCLIVQALLYLKRKLQE